MGIPVIPSVDSDTKLFPPAVLDAIRGAFGIASAPKVLTVKPDGTGDFTTPRLANASITDASALKPYVIKVYPGTYAADKGADDSDANSWIVKPYVTLSGTDRDKCIIQWAVPVNATDAQVGLQSALWLRMTSAVENLTVIIENGQYAIHDEYAGQNKDAQHRIGNVRMIHRGYTTLNAYRAANGGSAYVGAQNVYGWGAGSGVTVTIEDCTLESPYQTFLFHNNRAFDKRTTAEIRRSVLSSGSTTGGGLTVNSLGSGTPDLLTIIDSELDFVFIDDVDASWTTDEYADHSDIKIRLSGCNPVGYLNETRGLALRISGSYDDTSSAAGSQVKVSGSAVDVLFGQVNTRNLPTPNLNGMHGYVFGTFDVSGLALYGGGTGRTLADRLGDRRTSPVVLQAENQGGYAQQMNFNQDYRGMTNTQVVAAIQNGLGGAFSIDLWNPSKNEYYPRMMGHEARLVNAGNTTVRRFSPVVWADSTRRAFRAMTTSDTAAAFIGVTLDRIQDGKPGRVLRRGFLNTDQLDGFFTAITTGTAVYFSDDPARGFAPSGTRLAMTGSASGFVYFDRTAI